MTLIALSKFYHGIPATLPVLHDYKVTVGENEWMVATRNSDGARFFLGFGDGVLWFTPEGHLKDGRVCADTDNAFKIHWP